MGRPRNNDQNPSDLLANFIRAIFVFMISEIELLYVFALHTRQSSRASIFCGASEHL